MSSSLDNYDDTIAIVGMHIRVPGADTLEAYWENLRNGVESITFFSDDELRAAGVHESKLSDPDYVKAAGKLNGIEDFDASFFDMTPKEAEILDPQHRIMMEGIWKALEHAAIDPQRYPGRIGLYGGVGFNGYLIHHILTNPELLESAGGWQLSLNNDKDFATTRVAYKFNLQGPAISINTACSTSLVATTLAAQSLLNFQCDTAIASGCSIHLPQDQGYHFMTGGTLSPDGHCRPFDDKAAGTIDGNGTASVVLKRYEDAVKDGDTIYAVIRGFAVNNDGSVKVGYTAPSVEGQADVILEALEMAEVSPEQIDFVETHGTGTDLGDSVEITALAEAFKTSKNPCAIGSVKSNIGHLDTAAGVAGMIKVILSMQYGVIPPTCHFQKPNPTLGLEKTPFFVNNKAIEWTVKSEKSRLAGISSFGIGGTNAHVIVGQAPNQSTNSSNQTTAFSSIANEPSTHAHNTSRIATESSKLASGTTSETNISSIQIADDSKPGALKPDWVILPFSAKSVRALVDSILQLSDHIQNQSQQSIADIAYTLQTGRTQFDNRVVLLVRSVDHLTMSRQVHALATSLKSELSASGFTDISVSDNENTSKKSDSKVQTSKNTDISSKSGGNGHNFAQIRDFLYKFSEKQLSNAITSGAPDDLSQSAQSWLNGNLPDWDALSGGRKRVAIPGHPLYKQRYWIESKSHLHNNQTSSTTASATLSSTSKSITKEPSLDQWFYLPGWRKSITGQSKNIAGSKWLIIGDSAGLAESIILSLSDAGADFRIVYDQNHSLIDAKTTKNVSLKTSNEDSNSLGKKSNINPPKGKISTSDAKTSERETSITNVQFEGEFLDTTSTENWESYFKNHEDFKPEHIIHAGLFQQKTDNKVTLNLAFDGLISLGQALGQSFFSDDIDLVLISDGILAFDNIDTLNPAKTTALGPLRVMAQEYPNISTRAIDIDLSTRITALIAEISAENQSANVVLRGAQRWVQHFEPVKLGSTNLDDKLTDSPKKSAEVTSNSSEQTKNINNQNPVDSSYQNTNNSANLVRLNNKSSQNVNSSSFEKTGKINRESNQNPSKIKENGLYFITGGLGDIGLTLAKYISENYNVHFVLLSRSEFPDRSEWDNLKKNSSTPDRQKRQIQSVQHIESNECTVQIISADVSDEPAMKSIIDDLEKEHQRIDGIIHAAGIVGQSSFVTFNDARTSDGKMANQAQFPSKVDGTEVLGRILKDKSFDFCMVCSSLSPILGGLGFSAYAATNFYADALVEKLNLDQPGKWISVNWEGWMFDHDVVPGDASTSSALELGMTPEEGIDIFSRIIQANDLDRIVISSGNLQNRISQWVEKQPDAPESDLDDAPSHQRPIHIGNYTAPKSETEIQLVRLWGKLLGMNGIGVDDSFFELGGNSLLLTQLVAMIRKTFQAELALSAMFEHPTIAEIAKNIDHFKNGSIDSDDRDEGFI